MAGPDWSNHISAFCARDKHARCSGWMVIPDESQAAKGKGRDQSVRCLCVTCNHPYVNRHRHLIEAKERGEIYGVH